MADKIPTELLVDMDALADLVVAKLQAGFIGSLQADLLAFSKRLDDLEGGQVVFEDGTDGLRVALLEWANKRPPKEPKEAK